MINLSGPLLSNWPGRLHMGTTRCTIGWLPVDYSQSDAPSFETINATILSYICPQLSIRYQIDGNYKGLVHIPVQEDNEYGNKILTITMILDERQENYWALWRYMQTIQSGQTNGFPIKDDKSRVYAYDGFYRNRLTYIPSIQINIADDSFQKWTTLNYSRCYPVDISDLNFNFNSPGSEPVTFTITFLYSYFDIHKFGENTETVPCISR